ncbi:hypothetical protein EOM86_09875 [Candidatus Nomurabacteria bacterium]|nr:hypothetical protein [Candidatus Nomurabacteria bacterium]
MSSTINETWQRLSNSVQPYIDRAILFNQFCLPAEFDDNVLSGADLDYHAHQSTVSQGLQNIATRLTDVCFPVNVKFWKYGIDPAVREKYRAQGNLDKALGGLATAEKIINRYLDKIQIRALLYNACLQIGITGNCLIYMTFDGCKLYKLFDYRVERDGTGKIITVMTRDKVMYAGLPEEIKEVLAKENLGREYERYDELELYKLVERDGKRFKVQAAIDDVEIDLDEDESEYDETELPWIALRFTKADGDDYSRGLLERYIGDIASLDEISRAIDVLSKLYADVKFLVNPNSSTRLQQLAKAKTGDFVPGKRDDITCLQIDNYANIQFMSQHRQSLISSLSPVFLMLNDFGNRDRVTAEEIKILASRMDSSMGGVYSLLSSELQLPLVRAAVKILSDAGELPDLSEESTGLHPEIVTGLAALGREQDMQSLISILQLLRESQYLQQTVNPALLMTRLLIAMGIEPDDILFTNEQVQQNQMQAQLMAMAQAAAPQMAQAAGPEMAQAAAAQQ